MPLPVVLHGATTQEAASILLACDKARRVQEGFTARDAIGQQKDLWIELRGQASHLAESGAVQVWSALIDAGDDDARGALLGWCSASQK